MRDHRRAPIWNIYNAPVGADKAGSGLDLSLKSSNRPFYVEGDFNLQHPLWDMTNSSPRAACQELINRYGSLDLIFLNPRNSPTHNRGGTIDLFFSIDENTRCEIRKYLYTTSDHETLLPTARMGKLEKSKVKLRHKDLDDLFIQLLGSFRTAPRLSSATELELEASLLIQDIQNALIGNCPRIRPQIGGTPWWNSDCQRVVLAYRRVHRCGPAVLEN